MTEVTFSPYFLNLRVIWINWLRFLLVGSVFWQLIQTSSGSSEDLVGLEVLAVVDLIVWIVHLLL